MLSRLSGCALKKKLPPLVALYCNHLHGYLHFLGAEQKLLGQGTALGCSGMVRGDVGSCSRVSTYVGFDPL